METITAEWKIKVKLQARTLTLLLALGSLTGCASIKPYIVCELGSGKALVQQGIMGIGVGQELKDADSLCSPLRSTSTLPK